MSKPPLNPDRYQCACCHNVYQYGWTEDEALAEKIKLWGDIDIKDCAVICDDCFKIGMENLKREVKH